MKNTTLGTFFCLILLISITLTVPVSSRNNTIQNENLFSFNQYLELEIEECIDELPIDKTVYIPVTLRYWNDIPDFFFHPPFMWLKNWLLYGTFISPIQEIQLSVQDVPYWCQAYFGLSELNISITNEVQEIQTTLIISLNNDAPHEYFSLSLQAQTPKIKRINSANTIEQTTYLPEWLQSFMTMSPIMVQMSPGILTNVTIYIKNLGNADVEMLGVVITDLENWTVEYYQQNVTIPKGEQEDFVFGFVPPNDFQGMKNIEFEFIPYVNFPEYKIGEPFYISFQAFYP